MIKLKTPTPGDHLREILEDLRVSQYRFAKATGIPASGVGAIIAGNRRITVHWFSLR